MTTTSRRPRSVNLARLQPVDGRGQACGHAYCGVFRAPTDWGQRLSVTRPPVGIIVPAHDEEASIERCLAALVAQVRPGDRVVVICNGCTDRTAGLAKRFGQPVTVVELPVASKIAALNRGDELIGLHPRLYVDGDVVVGPGVVDRLGEVLSLPGVELAAPALHLDTRHASLPVRAYLSIWSRLPSVGGDTVGRGVYGLSHDGRARFGPFPDIIADDHFVRDAVPPAHRLVVAEVRSTVRAPGTLRGLMRRKVRAFAGNRALDASSANARARASARRREWIGVLRRHPSLIPAMPIYLLVSTWPRLQGTARRAAGRPDRWNRDDTSR